GVPTTCGTGGVITAGGGAVGGGVTAVCGGGSGSRGGGGGLFPNKNTAARTTATIGIGEIFFFSSAGGSAPIASGCPGGAIIVDALPKFGSMPCCGGCDGYIWPGGWLPYMGVPAKS